MKTILYGRMRGLSAVSRNKSMESCSLPKLKGTIYNCWNSDYGDFDLSCYKIDSSNNGFVYSFDYRCLSRTSLYTGIGRT